MTRAHEPERGRAPLELVIAGQEESLPLLRYLWAHACRPELTCRVSWRPGTLTSWDNRCTMHFAHNDYEGQRRVMRRVIVEGGRPS